MSGQAWRRPLAYLVRHPAARRVAAAFVVLIVATLLLMPMNLPFDGRLMDALETGAHFPLFLAAVLAWTLIVRPRPGWHALRMMLAGVFLAAVLVEALQSLTHRDPSLLDALWSSLGGWAAVLLWYSFHTARRVLIMGAWVLCVLLGFLVCIPSLLILADRAHARLSFPLLASFEGRSEVGRWWGNACRLSRVAAQQTHGQFALRVAVDDSHIKYPGLFMTDGERDWSGYRQLCFDLYLTGGSDRTLWVRADDRRDHPSYVDRAQTTVSLVPGANSICLDLDSFLRTPAGRLLDRAHLASWGMFFDDAQGGESFFLDHIRLTR